MISYRPSDLWDGTLSAAQLVARRALEQDEQRLKDARFCYTCRKRLPPTDMLVKSCCCAVMMDNQYSVSYGFTPYQIEPLTQGIRGVVGVKCPDCAGLNPDPWWWRI